MDGFWNILRYCPDVLRKAIRILRYPVSVPGFDLGTF